MYGETTTDKFTRLANLTTATLEDLRIDELSTVTVTAGSRLVELGFEVNSQVELYQIIKKLGENPGQF